MNTTEAPITGGFGGGPVGQAAEIHWSDFHILPPTASTYANHVDAIAFTWLIFSAFLIFLVFGMLTGFSTRFLSLFTGKKIATQKIPHKLENRMEWSWTLALIFISFAVGIWADWVYFRMHVPPPNAAEVYVVAKQWMWKIQHADGTREINELHVPLDTPIKLVMSSADVIHSFYVPAFRMKQDVVPGRYTYIWFTANVPGEYRLFCAEYCGTSHATMNGKVIVMKPADFANWQSSHVSAYPTLAGTNLASRGRSLFTNLGCISCHARGAPVLAPPLEGLYMSKVGLRTGGTVLADENYIRESILDPGAKIVKGYENIMPSFQGQVSEEDLLALIAYIKSLQFYKRPDK